MSTKEYKKEWREKNREKLNAYYREYNKTDKAKAYREDYRSIKNKKRRETAKQRKEFIQRYKLFCGCKICGYKKSAVALDFHHNGDDKEKDISKMVSRAFSLERIKAEIRKCVVLCANCHREHHE